MFTDNSSLKILLEEHQIILDAFFTPATLCQVLKDLFIQQNLEQQENKDIIIIDSKMQKIFNVFFIFLPELFDYCMPHIEKVPHCINDTLKQNYIEKNLFVIVPENLIYDDPTAVFYLHHQVNTVMKTNKFCFNWNGLLQLFVDFATNNPEFFVRNGNILQIETKLPMSNVLPFKYFHIKQCEYILKKITKYLGRKSIITFMCPYSNTPLFQNSYFCKIIKYIEEKIDEHTLPSFSPPLHF